MFWSGPMSVKWNYGCEKAYCGEGKATIGTPDVGSYKPLHDQFWQKFASC